MKARKYESWGEFLKTRREAKFRSAREFCSKVQVGISYPQYSRYEAGDQLPHLEQAIELFKLLEVPVLEGLLEWSRAQISDTSARGEVEGLLGRVRKGLPEPAEEAAEQAAEVTREEQVNKAVSGIGVFTTQTISLDDIIVFNRSHLRLFSSDPAYRDIFTYINSYAPEWISEEEIAEALGMAVKRAQEMLEQLSDLGVILLAGGKCRASKRNFYFPDDPDFFHLRNLNLTHNATAIMRKLGHEDLTQRRAYRGLITRELTAEQLDRVISRLDETVSSVVGMPETPNPEKIFSLCVLLGERFTRPRRFAGDVPGLRQSLSAPRGKNEEAPASP
jgi:transcriptional regulator with XRE-family HTH domain